MHIQLVFPPGVPYTDYPPLGLGYIGAALEKAGHRVSILDASALQLSWSDIVERIKTFRPDIIGITAGSIFFNNVKKLSFLLDSEFPTAPQRAHGLPCNGQRQRLYCGKAFGGTRLLWQACCCQNGETVL